jgi:NTE family protein
LWVAEARLAGSSQEEAEAKFPEITAHVLEVSFDNLSDPLKRSRLQNMPTSFVLPAEDVDQLREAAGELLRQSQEYQSMLQGFQATSPE